MRRVRLPASGVTLRVLEAGPADGPPLLLLHGFAVSAYLWRHNILPLAARGFRVVVPDLPGHGLSDAPAGAGRYSLASFTSDLRELLDVLEIPTVALSAQSMAGKIAVQFALESPARVSRLVLFGAVGFGVIPRMHVLVPFLPEPPVWFIPRRLVAFVQRRVYGKLGFFTELDVDEYWAPTQFPAVVRAQLQMLREFDWKPWDEATLRALETPTHVIFGTRDRTVRPVRAERLAALLPKGRFTWIHDGGHVVMEEIPERINSMLAEEFD